MGRARCKLDAGTLVCRYRAKNDEYNELTDKLFPDIIVYIQNKPFLIRSKHLKNRSYSRYSEDNEDELEMVVYSNIAKAGKGPVIFGIPFFLSNYVVFDQENNQIGFYAKNEKNFEEGRQRANFLMDLDATAQPKSDLIMSHKGSVDANKGVTYLNNEEWKNLLSKFDKEEDMHENTHQMGIVSNQEPTEEIQYLIYILMGIDSILGCIIIAYIWRKRYVFSTGRWRDLLEV
jgi:hypothetical protein